ncbi:MAG: aspartate kinase [Bacteroidetes bacterium]|nr:aspartate kinase [Bacteroidota bacterium]
MKVFKFGGASVNSIKRIQNIQNILKQYSTDNLLVIISAMGKTTNALEKVAESFYAANTNEALALFEIIKQQHLDTAQQLMPNTFTTCKEKLNEFFTEVEWLLHDKPVRHYDYYYDQIVSIGELMSTCIVSCYLNELKVDNTWLDVRDIIKTDNNFRDAGVDWEKTGAIISNQWTMQNNQMPNTQYPTSKVFITQGFIGCTDDNETTTLGREGSDYTAAIFANLLNAQSVSIWKDVEGVMNADPKQFSNAQLISELSFEDVIEMAFYGAQVIHPKTIKPLQNKKIPLYVKCFLDASLPGTVIQDKIAKNLPPIIVVKEKQVLMNLHTQDFSFVGEKPMSFLYNLFEEIKIKPNLIQTGAINVQICLDDIVEKIDVLASKASSIFNVQLQKNLSLLTIRNYNSNIVNEMLADKKVLLQQTTQTTMQALCF